jgi:hypothetical protein
MKSCGGSFGRLEIVRSAMTNIFRGPTAVVLNRVPRVNSIDAGGVLDIIAV